MTEEHVRPPEERFLDEMVEGYLDGRKADNPEPSSNRSLSYRHGFANGRDDLAGSPRLPAHALRVLADRAIADDVAMALGRTAAPRAHADSVGGCDQKSAKSSASSKSLLSS